MNNTKKLIGSRINSALALRGMKQKELAKILGVTDNTVSYYVSGARTPNAEQIIAIANALDVSADYLLGLTDTKAIEPDIKTACEVTGLSEESISYLNILKDASPKYLTFISRLLSYELEYSMAAEKNGTPSTPDFPATPIWGLFYYCDFYSKYLNAPENILSYSNEEISKRFGNGIGSIFKKINNNALADSMMDEIKTALNTFSRTYYKGGDDTNANDHKEE